MSGGAIVGAGKDGLYAVEVYELRRYGNNARDTIDPPPPPRMQQECIYRHAYMYSLALAIAVAIIFTISYILCFNKNRMCEPAAAACLLMAKPISLSMDSAHGAADMSELLPWSAATVGAILAKRFIGKSSTRMHSDSGGGSSDSPQEDTVWRPLGERKGGAVSCMPKSRLVWSAASITPS
eukprot:SAG31_NODE_4106_length_3577_cov_3.156699_1_plen_181_part_00